MADKSDFLSESMLRVILRGEALKVLKKGNPFWLSLHDADPGAEGRQDNHELDYPGYSRIAIKRAADWDVSGPKATLSRQVEFGLCTGGEKVYAQFAALGTDETGPGELLYRLRALQPILIEPGVRPRVPAGSLTISES